MMPALEPENGSVLLVEAGYDGGCEAKRGVGGRIPGRAMSRADVAAVERRA